MQQQYLIPNWPQPKNIRALTTLKNFQLAELPDPLAKCWLNQVHQNTIIPATANTSEDQLPAADGSYTFKTNLGCLVKTADCLPILITNLPGNFVAALHAGWRGLANGILENFFTIVTKLKLKLPELLFWLGPAIGPNAFEVGPEIVAIFGSRYLAAFTPRNVPDRDLADPATSKYLANIYSLAKIKLQDLGITAAQIFSDHYCTYTDQERFYSYRRNPTQKHRMYSMIWIES